MKTFQQLKKNLKKDAAGLEPIKVAVLGDSATQLFVQAFRAYGYEEGILLDIFEADFNQIERQIFDQNSELYSFKPEFVVVFQSTQKLLHKFYSEKTDEQIQFAEKHCENVLRMHDALVSKLPARMMYLNFPEVFDGIFGNYSNKVENSFLYQIRKINYELMKVSCANKDFFICDFAAIQNEYGRRAIFDAKMYANADMVVQLDYLPILAKRIIDSIVSVKGRVKKCLIVDLDNTLWGGIVGEDGMENLQIGYLGIGKVFTELQLWIKQLKSRGIILAVCSANDEKIAKEPFEKHPDMVLRLEDIAVFIANWKSKVENIKQIQNILNIGFDSMVFLDDSPFERNLVRTQLPQVTVPDLPEDPAEYIGFLREHNLFEVASLSIEDTRRTEYYRREAQRSIAQKECVSDAEFLASLKMASHVSPFNSFVIPRVTQLIQRSNQFNLRTIRYSEDEVKRIAGSDEFGTFSFTLSDTFGDHGLISVVIVKKMDKDLFVDTWIMSCRVLKRGVESFVLNTFVAWAKQFGYRQIIGEYIPTAKNGLVKDLYAHMGFISDNQRWKLNVDKYAVAQTYIVKAK